MSQIWFTRNENLNSWKQAELYFANSGLPTEYGFTAP